MRPAVPAQQSAGSGAVGRDRSFFQLLKAKDLEADRVDSVERGRDREILEASLQEIRQRGAHLRANFTKPALYEYRALIQRFLRQVINSMHQLEEVMGRLNVRTGHRKKYSLIRLIDEKLDNLLQLVLHEERDHLELLGKIESINGLLVDLLS